MWKKDQVKTFYSSEAYIQKNNDFKNIKEESNLISVEKHKKHDDFIYKSLSELKEKIKIESVGGQAVLGRQGRESTPWLTKRNG